MDTIRKNSTKKLMSVILTTLKLQSMILQIIQVKQRISELKIELNQMFGNFKFINVKIVKTSFIRIISREK